jgi:hypothetical protein
MKAPTVIRIKFQREDVKYLLKLKPGDLKTGRVRFCRADIKLTDQESRRFILYRYSPGDMADPRDKFLTVRFERQFF